MQPAPGVKQEYPMEQVTITRHGGKETGEYQAHIPGSEAIGRLTRASRAS